MRKLILQEWISLNGYAADAQGTTEFFNKPEYNEGSDKDLLAFIGTVDTILLGANTYRMFAQYWPAADAKTEIIADKLNETPKIVFSKSLTAAPWGNWQPAAIERSDAVEAVRKLKEQSGKNMVIWGSLKLAKPLMEAGLIDEYEVRICPTILDSGVPLFPAGILQQLKLLETKPYPSGLVLVRYTKA